MKKIFNLMLVAGIVPSVMAEAQIKIMPHIIRYPNGAALSPGDEFFFPPYGPAYYKAIENEIQNEAIEQLTEGHNKNIEIIKSFDTELTNTILKLRKTTAISFIVTVYTVVKELLNIININKNNNKLNINNYKIKQIAAETIEPEKNTTTSSKLSFDTELTNTKLRKTAPISFIAAAYTAVKELIITAYTAAKELNINFTTSSSKFIAAAYTAAKELNINFTTSSSKFIAAAYTAAKELIVTAYTAVKELLNINKLNINLTTKTTNSSKL